MGISMRHILLKSSTLIFGISTFLDMYLKNRTNFICKYDRQVVSLCRKLPKVFLKDCQPQVQNIPSHQECIRMFLLEY